MGNSEPIKLSLENSFALIEQKMEISSDYITSARNTSRYIPFIEGGGYNYSESKKKEELERLRKSVSFYTIKAIKVTDLILKEINNLIDTLKNNKNAYWFSSLFNRVVEMKEKLDNQIFDAKSLKDKYGNNKIDFESIDLKEDDFVINDFIIIKKIGIDFEDFNFTYYEDLINKYGKADKSNMDIIYNEYTQRSSSFDLNRKLRKGESLDENENKIYSAIINSCNNNILEKNIYLFRYVSQEFIKKYNIEFNRLSQSSVSNAIYNFKTNVIDKKIKEKECGFISSSCNLEKNVFNSRDVLLILYVEKGCHLYVTNNKEETEIILPPGLIYQFFDCFFIEVKRLVEKCYQMVIKTFIKNDY